MTANNALLYNAAQEGFYAGALRDRWLTKVNSGTPPVIGTPDNSYALLVDQANRFAIECDSKVPNDNAGTPVPAGSQAISVITTGVAIAPTTNAIQFAQLMKVRLFAAFALGITEGRYYGQPNFLDSSGFSTVVTSSYAAYLQIAQEIAAGITDTNNEVIFFGCLAGCIAGMFSAAPGAWPADEFTNVVALADTLSDAVDTGIPNDSGMSAGNGQVLAANANAVLQQYQYARVKLIYSIALAVMQDRNPLSLENPVGIEAGWAAGIAPVIIAAYKAIAPSLVSTSLTTSPPINPIIWNDAFNGFVAGKFGGRNLKSTSQTDPWYLAVAAAAVHYANAIDAAVGGSDTAGSPIPTGTQGITVAGESITPIEPTTGPIQEGAMGKSGLIWAICRGTQYGRPLLNTTQDNVDATYAVTAKSVVALYLDACLGLLTP